MLTPARKLRELFPLPLLLLVALALLVRLPFLPLSAHLPGDYSDIETWKGWTASISSDGFRNVFNTTDINYVGYNYFLWLIAAVYSRISPEFDTSSTTLHVLVKLPPVLFDLALVWITFVLSRRLLRDHPHVVASAKRRFPSIGRLPMEPQTALALAPAAIVALHPAIIHDSAAWSQTDGIITFFILASIMALAAGSAAGAMFLWTIGFIMKPHPLFMLPLLLALVWWRFGWRGLARGAVGTIAALVLMLGYWVANGKLGEIGHVYRMLFTEEGTLSMQAWNFWWFVNLRSHPVPSDTLIVLGNLDVTYKMASMLLFGLAMLLALGYLHRRRDIVGLLEASAFMAFAFYMLPVSTHERYMFPLLGLLAPVLLVKPRWLFLYVPVSVTFFLNLFLVGPLWHSLSGRYLDGELSVAVAAAHLLMFGLLAAFFGLRAIGWRWPIIQGFAWSD